MKLELNAHEAQILINLIDIAVKSSGLAAAEAGAYFSKKITDALNEEARQAEEASKAA